MTIGKVEHGASVMPVGRPLVRLFGIDVTIKTTVRLAVGGDNHIGRTLDLRLFDFADNVDVATHSELASSRIFETPIVIAIGKASRLGDGIGIYQPSQRRNSANDGSVRVGVPGGIYVGSGTPKRFAVVTHVAKNADGPDVVKRTGGPKAPRIFSIVADIHDCGQTDLPQVI